MPIIMTAAAADNVADRFMIARRLLKAEQARLEALKAAKRSVAPAAIVAASLVATDAGAASLTFDQLVGQTTGSTVIGNSGVAQELTTRFLNVATDQGYIVDAEVRATVKSETDFGTIGRAGNFGDAGLIPNYQPWGADAAADLGFLYYGNGINENENGISLEFTFFDGTGALSGSFENTITVKELSFAIYDVDGESRATGSGSDQSEYFSAFTDDGLVSYQLGSTPQALTATEMGHRILFEGPGQNYAEADASGAVVLNYENTSSFSLDFGSQQFSGARQNGVFSAMDGDLSLFAADDFADPVTVTPVPLPAAWALMLSCFAALAVVKARLMKSAEAA